MLMGSSNSDERIAQRYFYGEVGKSALVNKFGIQDQQELDKVEKYYTELAMMRGFSDKARHLSPNGLKQMHQEFFGHIYDWAGQFRPYTTGRGLPFCRPEFIESELTKLYHNLHRDLYLGIDKENFVKIVAKFLGNLNAIHPFIDGNGRTQRQTLLLICHQFHFTIQINDYLSQKYWYQSAEQSHYYGDDTGFEEILRNIIEQ